MSTTWHAPTKYDAISALQSAHDDLADALECAAEMDDHVVEEHVEKAQEVVDDLVAFLEMKR